MQNQTIYNVGDHRFSVCCNSQTHLDELLPSFVPFIDTLAGKDLLFELKLEQEKDGSLQNSLRMTSMDDSMSEISFETSFEWEDARCEVSSRTDGSARLSITPKGMKHACSLSSNEHFASSVAYLPADYPASQQKFVVNNFLMMLYAFRASEKNTLLFHASVIAYSGRGYLFLGKSGTGKSTHTSLWLKHVPGCHLLNDDNPIVRVFPSGETLVYGSPWSGKTPCYRNEQMPVGAFVRLQQYESNHIQRESQIVAFSSLLPSCSCLKRDAAVYKGVVATITRLAQHVPVYHLKCLPDEAAARLSLATVTSLPLDMANRDTENVDISNKESDYEEATAQ